MGQIFLFTKDAKVGNETRKLLKEHGFIPVEVARMDAVQLVAEPVPEVSSGVILRAALRAISKANKDGSYAGKYLSEELAAVIGKEPV